MIKLLAAPKQIKETSGVGSAHRMIIEDLRTDGKPSAQLSRGLVDAGVRALTATPLLSSTGNVLGIVSTFFDTPHRPSERELRLVDLLARQTADYLERKHAEKIQKTLIGEIQHRSNNLLAIIQAIAHRSLSGDGSSSEAGKAFEARLQALARANRELIKSNWAGVNLKEIVRLELEPFAERALIEGTDIRVGPQLAQNFSLALHELATNAAKYGALSDRNGKVGIYWTIVREGESSRLKLKWQERGGPQVSQGFGTTLLRAVFPDARFDYATEGFNCEVYVLLKTDEPDASGVLGFANE